MVQLIDSDIRTREVLDWQGLHILHAKMSSCSQKLRIFLNLKGIEWQGHEMNLGESETYGDWFLGINPRGLVPVLVWDGEVHIESNDILALLDERFPESRLIPQGRESEVSDLLRMEDELHLDLRSLSFRFVIARTTTTKPPELLDRYRNNGGTVNGAPDDAKRAPEITFYERFAAEGITDQAAQASAAKFRVAFDDLEARLDKAPYFLGSQISVMDIAWFVYVTRLQLGGYPFARLHPRVEAWRQGLAADPRFADEVAPPPPLMASIETNQAAWRDAGTTLADVAGW